MAPPHIPLWGMLNHTIKLLSSKLFWPRRDSFRESRKQAILDPFELFDMMRPSKYEVIRWLNTNDARAIPFGNRFKLLVLSFAKKQAANLEEGSLEELKSSRLGLAQLGKSLCQSVWSVDYGVNIHLKENFAFVELDHGCLSIRIGNNAMLG